MKIPGTNLEAAEYARMVYAHSRERGRWDTDETMAESLVHVAVWLTAASCEYKRDVILPPTFYRPTGVTAAHEGAVYCLAEAVVDLLDLAGRYNISPVLMGDSSNAAFYSQLFSAMSRILRIPTDYPVDAIPMIERMAGLWISRAEFWKMVLEVEAQ